MSAHLMFRFFLFIISASVNGNSSNELWCRHVHRYSLFCGFKVSSFVCHCELAIIKTSYCDSSSFTLWHFLQFFILHTCMGACICISIPQRCREEEKFVLCIIMCKAISSFCKRKSRSKRTLKRFQLSLVVAGWKVMGILDTGNVLANSKNVQTLDIKKGIERTLLSNFDILICFNLPFWLVMKSSSGQ